MPSLRDSNVFLRKFLGLKSQAIRCHRSAVPIGVLPMWVFCVSNRGVTHVCVLRFRSWSATDVGVSQLEQGATSNVPVTHPNWSRGATAVDSLGFQPEVPYRLHLSRGATACGCHATISSSNTYFLSNLILCLRRISKYSSLKD